MTARRTARRGGSVGHDESRLVAGRYRLLQEVGRGGMGVVWRAEDELLEREVALKRVARRPEADASVPDLARAEREARLAGSLNHPHVVAVFDLAAHDGEQWLVMEYVPGSTLAELVRDRGPLDPDAAAVLLWQAADALAAAHRAGIVHRDVKPSNILVTADGRVKLSDFGIARAAADAALTQTGLVTGSPAYLSPEVATGGTATAASDVWALGATLFHALEGRAPYNPSENLMGTLFQIAHEPPPRPAHAGWLAPLVERTMTPDPADRWPMAQVRDVLAGGPDGARGAAGPGASETTRVSPAVPPGRAAASQGAASQGAASQGAAPRAGDATAARRSVDYDDPPPPTHIAPLPVDQTRPRRSRRQGTSAAWPLLLVLSAALVAALVVGWLLWQSQRDRPAAQSPREPAATSSAPEPSARTEPTPSDEPVTGPRMTAFVEDYLATVTTDSAAAWEMLTPEYQNASGGFGGYRGFWGGIAEAEPGRIRPDPGAMTVSYDVAYTRSDGSTFDDQVTLVLVQRDGTLLIADDE